jgi:hypothetical protein
LGLGQEGSSFSEEKEAKRLLSICVRDPRMTYAHGQEFFASFLQKRRILLAWAS